MGALRLSVVVAKNISPQLVIDLKLYLLITYYRNDKLNQNPL